MSKLLLSVFLVFTTFLSLRAQPLSLSILYGPPNDPPSTWSTGNVFQVGNQFGDAAIYALFGGSGTRSFQIASPGEGINKTVTGDGYFNIRPTGNLTVDRTKILNFNGTVSGSVVVTVRQLAITTQLSVPAAVSPGATLPVVFSVGVGTFPVGMGFKVQLLNAAGTVLQDLSASLTYTTREPATYSSGDIRSIPATLPGNLAPGTYRVQVVSVGLATTVFGSVSGAFQVQAAPTPITTVITNINPHTICVGYTGLIRVSWTATDDGLQASKYSIGVFSANATTTDTPIRSIANLGIYLQSSGSLKTLEASTTGLNSLPVGSYKLAILHSTISTNLNFSNPFVVQSAPTVVISAGTPTINLGAAATVRLTFGGGGPWSLTYDDLKNGIQTLTNRTENPIDITLYPTNDYLFSTDKLLTFNGFCGSGTKSGSSQIRVSRLAITLGTVSLPNPCPGNNISVSFTVSGSVPTGTRYTLQFSDASGSFANPRELASGTGSPLVGPTPMNDAPGTGYRIRVVSDNATLPISGESAITLTRPALPTVTNQSFCTGGTPPTLSAIGTSLQWYSGDASGQSFGATAPTPPADQSSSYRVTQTVNGCQSGPALLTITAKPKSALPSVSGPVNACLNQPAPALTAQGVNLLWYNSSQQSLGANAPLPATNVAVPQTFYVSQDANGCRSDLAPIMVNVAASPALPTLSAPAPVCQFALVANTVLSAAVTGQNLRWYDGEQGGATNQQPPTPRTSTDGTERYYVSQVINGCESGRARLEQTVLKAPDRPTVGSNPVLFCLNEMPRSLSANGSGLRWYQQATGGNFTTEAPLPTTNRVGITSYYVSQLSGAGNCESVRLQLDVSVLSQPAAPVVTANQSVCQNTRAVALQATGTNLQWSGSGITGISNTAPTPPTNLSASFTYQVIQRAGSCNSPASTLIFTVKPQPTAPVVASPRTFCQGAGAADLTAQGENLRWFETADGSDLARDRVSFTPSTAGAFNYYVKQTVNGCESPLSRLDVRVSILARATLSGDSIVTLFDSTAIRIRFTGEAPYTLTLWTSTTITTTDNPLVIWEKPTTANATYTLLSLSNNCGPGIIGNTYRLSVRTPLAIEPLQAGLLLLSANPNPSSGPVTILWNVPVRESVTLRLVSLTGQTVWQVDRHGTSHPQTESLQTDHLPSGLYVLSATTVSGRTIQHRVMVVK